MSLVNTIEAELAKARADVGAAIEFFTHKAEDALKKEVDALLADKGVFVSDLKGALDQAKAAALAEVQAADPAAVAAVSQALSAVETAVLGVIEKHLP